MHRKVMFPAVFVALGLIPFGVTMIVWGTCEQTLLRGASAEPETVSLTDLAARGAAGNPHLLLRDFSATQNFHSRKTAGGFRARTYVPLSPRDASASGRNWWRGLVVVRIDTASDEALLADGLEQGELEVLVVNRVTWLGDEDRRALGNRSTLAERDITILAPGRRPWSPGVPVVVIVLGVALLLPFAVLWPVALPAVWHGYWRASLSVKPPEKSWTHFRFAVAFLVMTGSCVWSCWKECWHVTSFSDTPEPLTLRELSERGSGGNPYVLVTDFQVADPVTRVGGDYMRGDHWIPLVPASIALGSDDGKAPAQEIKALIKTRRISDSEDVDLIFRRLGLAVMVQTTAASLPPSEQALLASAHPGIDLRRCLILEETAEPPGWLNVAMYAAGIVVFGIASLLTWFPQLLNLYRSRPAPAI